MNKDKLKILIISCYFPPLNVIGGMRVYFWAKYWSKMGHEICVVTIKNDLVDSPLNLPIDADVQSSVRIEKVPLPHRVFDIYSKKQNRSSNKTTTDKPKKPPTIFGKLIKKIKRAVNKYSGIDIYSPHLWAIPAVKRSLEIYEQWPFDIIVSTFGPPATHLTASMLKRKLNVFWVADYRDLWYGNYYYSGKWPFSFIEKCIESFVVKKADFFTTVSSLFSEQLIARFGNRVATFENGFDTESLEKIPAERAFPDDGKVRLVYIGQLYREKQSPERLFEAIGILKNRGISVEQRIEILFYGHPDAFVTDMITKYNLDAVVKVPGFIPREKTLQVQRDADMLIFIDWQNLKDMGMIPGKFFEYMHSGTPILNISSAPNSVPSKLIETTGVGITVANAPEPLADIMEEVIQGKKVPYNPAKDVLARYTRKYLSEKMLEEIIEQFNKRQA
jgi:glycosyltransferase involved in cell wall biosynthesis